ncbi:MAG: right-handed parallel beta-helix repeat-containing protein [Bryobacterales bacterium]|nr:right-handed parallel beta-helix repeat-containing protein [Bryobacterales bacterium]
MLQRTAIATHRIGALAMAQAAPTPAHAHRWIVLATLMWVAVSVLAGAPTAAKPVCAPSRQASACLQAAVDTAKPGSILHLGPGSYVLDAPLQLTRDDITVQGQGDATVLVRAVTVENGDGLLNLRAHGVTLRRLRVDGQVTEPELLPYTHPAGAPSVLAAPIHGDPMHPLLLRNTSITIHRGSSRITLEEVTIQRTGGYAILIDARYAPVRDITLRRLHLRDNRPHLFGRPGDIRYGSWTGGIHYQNDGRDLDFARHALIGLTVEDCLFERLSGHAFWGHGYGFQTLNQDILVRRNRFVEIGMDAVLIANATNATVEGNQFHRIGYVAAGKPDDLRPAWYPGLREDGADNIPAVAIDTSGLVRHSAYRNNSMVNVNGHCIDLDGFTQGAVTGNLMRVSGREDAFAYTNDHVEEFGGHRQGNFTKGINLSNTAAAAPTEDVRIEGNTLINMGGFAIALNDSQRCVVANNHIRHYGAIYAPIILTHSLRQPRQHHVSRENTITGNYIHFYLEAFCVTEADDLGGGPLPVEGPNYVHGNTCDANTHGEFAPGAHSLSRAAPHAAP